jgi:hypothetical protein
MRWRRRAAEEVVVAGEYSTLRHIQPQLQKTKQLALNLIGQS